MSKFITGKELGETIYNIIWEAESELLIVSPYIKLDAYFKKLFNKHLTNPKIQITIVFGKNEGQINKSFNKEDLEYFKQFLNVSIVYVPNLHAKYYANEYQGILTSINLYDYSFINNIEFGVLYENKFSGNFFKRTDEDAWQACMNIADANQLVFVKRPVFQKKLFSKNYMSSKIIIDRTEDFYSGKSIQKSLVKLSDINKELDYAESYSERPTREEIIKPAYQTQEIIEKPAQPTQNEPKLPAAPPGMGYCIRTGVIIPFNPEKPLCYQAYKSWSQFENENFPEKYCHYSGELSNGETTIKRPILYKNWRKSQQVYQF